jgi:O2-independent ubiquinone biosynthesis accessory factor UbiT
MTPPVFPTILQFPLKFLPNTVLSRIFTQVLNRLLRTPLLEGDLDFLDNKTLHIQVSDIPVCICLSLSTQKLVLGGQAPDVLLQGSVHDFLLLASREQDADTLFFQRRLKISGETDLGLEIKNFLDALDIESMSYHEAILNGLSRINRVYVRWC